MTTKEIEKFEIGESFIYQNGESVELGVVKSIVRDNEYFCYYHTGDTAALTHARNMKKIRNNYAFEIRRKGVNER